MKAFIKITLTTILATTSMMTMAEPTIANDTPLEASTTTVKHQAVTVTLTDKHFTSADDAETADNQKLTQNHDADSESQPAI
ncbi:hypothetical protein [Vibrio gigantis]|uniref:hypothetical protein n=1 Tax=Vibrio gigantis TaxID=296199 RepID=UPI001BFDBB40|nr:hypothetical protein [Vibrio gigantis]